MRWRWRVLGVLAPLALALLLITSNVRWALNTTSLHNALFARHGVAERTGITSSDLDFVAQEMKAYLTTGTQEPLQITVPVQGARRSLFSQREALHMADVKGLFNLTFRVQESSALFVLVAACLVALRFRRSCWKRLARWARHGALLTGGLVMGLGLLSVTAFGPLFTLFHRIGFRNEFWLLDPSTDFLVIVYPLGFWRDVTLLIGLAVLVEAALLFVAGRFAVSRGPGELG